MTPNAEVVMSKDKPQANAGSTDLVLPEFDQPPADPIGLFRDWFASAAEHGVSEPGAVALATADAGGLTSNRMVQTIKITDEGLVFTSHTGSQKGRDIAATGWASGVLYWRETKQQIILTGPVEQLSDAESDELWTARPPSTHPMSVASRQSELLADEEELRAQAQLLAENGQALPRPDCWAGYRLSPSTMEFWHASPDRLHRRLRYNREDAGWTPSRLQP
jgi:dihydrophenazinedicarboxylate synthase